MKSEGAAAQVGRWYGAGTAEYGGMGGGIQDCMVHAYGGACVSSDVACRVAIDNLRVAINNLRVAIQIPIAIIRLP